MLQYQNAIAANHAPFLVDYNKKLDEEWQKIRAEAVTRLEHYLTTGDK